MAGNKSGKKGRGKKGSHEEEELVQPGAAGVRRSINDGDEPSSSDLSDNESDFELEDSSVDSDGKRKSHGQKGKSKQDDAQPLSIDLTGLPEDTSKRAQKHNLQSSDKSPQDKGKKKSDEEAEDTNVYDLSQVEVINVDAEDDLDERDCQRLKIGKIVWEKYGSDIIIYEGTADFLLYLIGELEDDTKAAKAPLTTTEKKKFVDHFGPFTIVSLYYLHSMAYSQLFKALTERNLQKSVTGCHFHSFDFNLEGPILTLSCSPIFGENECTKKDFGFRGS